MESVELKKNIMLALDEIRPFLASDGCDISLVSIKDDVVNVRFHGACEGGKVNQMTLKTGVEMTVKKYAPQIKKVVSI